MTTVREFGTVLAATAVTTTTMWGLWGCASSADAPMDAAGTPRQAAASRGPLAAVAFMAGHWKGEHDGGTWEEHWSSDEGGLMVCTSKMVVGGKCVFFEFSKIDSRGERVVLEVRPMGGSTTEFVLDPEIDHALVRPDLTRKEWEQTSSRLDELKRRCPAAVFLNPEHDYPNRIVYARIAKRDGDRMQVELSGVEKGVAKHETIVMRLMK